MRIYRRVVSTRPFAVRRKGLDTCPHSGSPYGVQLCMVISDLWWHHAQIRCWSARCSPQLSCKYSGKTQDSTAICQWMCVWHIQIAPVVVESWVAYDVIWHVQWILDILSTSRQTIELFIRNCVLPQKRKVLTVLLCTPLNVHSRACYKGTTPWCKCSRPHLTHQISCDNYKWSEVRVKLLL